MPYQLKCILVFLILLATPMPLQAEEYHNPDLPSLLTKNDGTQVTTPAQWKERRNEILELMCDNFIGSFPDTVPNIISTQILSESQHNDGSTRRNVRLTFDTPNHASFDMWVWIPQGDGPKPLLLTQPRFYQMEWAEEALSRGYTVCLYPGLDSHHSEASYPNYQNVWNTFRTEYPEATWTETSTKAWLGSRTLDYLLDPQAGYGVAEGQVGIIGFSRYGKQAMIAGAIDQRITSVVARSPGSPASTPYRFSSRNTFNEAPQDFPDEWFLPSLRSYTGREDELPMDAHAWGALISPRNLLVHTAYNDSGEPTFGVERAYVAGSEVYQLLGVEDHYRVDYRPGGHCTGAYPNYITPAQVDRNLDWMDVSFGRGTVTRDAFPQEYIHKLDWNAWQSNLTPQEKQNPFAGTQPTNNADRLARINWTLGQAPAKEPFNGSYTFFTAEESELMTHDRWQVAGTARVPVSFGDNVRGNIYYNTEQSGPAPVVIWLHPYSYATGYNEGYGVENTTVYHKLASRGYTVLAFDQVGFGLRLLEGRDFQENNPKWSRLGQMIEDVKGAVDFLVDGKGAVQGTMPEIDPEQIHVLGYSLGGMVGLYSAAMDDRITSVASFSGFTPMRTDTSDKSTGGIERLWDWHALQPMLGLFDGQESQIPYDFEDVLALVAPRPCMIYSPQNDRDADYSDVLACVNNSRQFWEQTGASENLSHLSPDDYNRFQSTQHEAYLRWLETIAVLPNEKIWLQDVNPWDRKTPDATDTSLRLWLKADVGLVDADNNPIAAGNTIYKWINQASTGADATKHRGSPTLQTITRDGRTIPVVHFDGSSGFEAMLGKVDQPEGSIFFVADQQQGGNQKWLAFCESDGTSPLNWLGTGNQGENESLDFGLGYLDSETDRIEKNAVTSTGGLHIYTITWGEEDGEIIAQLFVDGRLKSEVSEDAALRNNFTLDSMLFRLGQRAWSDSGYFIGNIGEVMFYDQNLSYQNINNIGASLSEKYAIESIFLTTPPIPGDANNDGKVDGSDVTILASNWQVGVGGVGGATWAMGDFNGDGAVDGSDVTILAANWQHGVAHTAASVPEPSVVTSLLTTLMMLVSLRAR